MFSTKSSNKVGSMLVEVGTFYVHRCFSIKNIVEVSTCGEGGEGVYARVLHSRSIFEQFYKTILCILHAKYIPKDNTGPSYSCIALL